MKTINLLRAKMLNEHFGSNAAGSFSEMVTTIMKMPSYTEKECCYGSIKAYPIVYLNNDTFKNDFSNLVRAIEDNRPEALKCTQCNRSPRLRRKFESHVLIEVKKSTVDQCERCRFSTNIFIYAFLYADYFL